MELSVMDTQTLYATCQQERTANCGDPSPASIELVRRAFAGDQDAWALLCPLVEPLMRSWIGVQQAVDVDDVLQEALLQFFRFAPRCGDLLEGDALGPALDYLRKTTKTALLTLLRKQRRSIIAETLSSSSLSTASTEDNFTLQVEGRSFISETIQKLLYTDEEQLIFQLYFCCGIPPREIMSRHKDVLVNIKRVNTLIQRLKRRFKRVFGNSRLHLSDSPPRRWNEWKEDSITARQAVIRPCAFYI